MKLTHYSITPHYPIASSSMPYPGPDAPDLSQSIATPYRHPHGLMPHDSTPVLIAKPNTRTITTMKDLTRSSITNLMRNSLASVRMGIATLFIFASLFMAGDVFGQVTQVGTATNGTTTGTSLIVSKPSGVQVGDVMFASIVQGEATGQTDLSDAALAGWTVVTGSQLNGQNPEYWGTLLYKIAIASDVAATTYTFTLDAQNSGAIGSIIAFRGVNTAGLNQNGGGTGPFDIDPGVINNIATDVTLNATAISTSTTNTAIVMFGFMGDDDNNDVTGWTTATAGGLTELFEFESALGQAQTIAAAWRIFTGSGSTGAGSATLANSNQNGSILIALRSCTPPSVTAITGPNEVCNPGSGLYSNSTPGGTWATSNTAVATINGSGTVTAVSNGDVDVIYTVVSGNCQTSVSKRIRVGVPAQTSTIVGGTAMCANTLGADYSVTNVPGTMYTWSIDGNPAGWSITSGQGTSSIMLTAGATFPQTLRVVPSNSCGNGTARTLSIVETTGTPTYCTTCTPCTEPTTNNPNLGGSCADLKVVLVLDESSSIVSPTNFEPNVEAGVLAFVNTLNCTGVQLSIVEFNNQARFVFDTAANIWYRNVDNALVTAVQNYLGNVNNALLLNDADYSPGVGTNYTNWQSALLAVDHIPEAPDLVIFFTDGVPTKVYLQNPPPNFGTDGDPNCGDTGTPDPAEYENAAKVANLLKCSGVHMFMAGVGGIVGNEQFLQELSGTIQYVNGVNDITNSDYATGNFDQLALGLSTFVSELCPFDSDVVAQDICPGGTNGSITISLPPALLPYSYQYYNNITNTLLGSGVNVNTNPLVLTNLAVGSYRIEVQVTVQGSGCTRTEIFFETIAATAVPVVAAVTATSDPTCLNLDGGSATLTITAGEAPYTITLKKAGVTEPGYPIVVFSTIFTDPALDGGMYTFEVQDANMCNTDIDAFTITAPTDCCPTTCTVTGGPGGNVCPNTEASFGVTTSGGTCTTPTYSWSIISNTSGASIVGSSTGASVTVSSGTTCGSYTIESTVTCSGCSPLICTQVVNVVDVTPPTITTCAVTRNLEGCNTAAITGPNFSTVSASSSEGVFENGTNQGVTSDNCAITSVTYIDVAVGTCPTVVTRTWTISDACGNTNTCNQTINVDDTVNPSITTCPVARVIEGCGASSITGPAYSTVSASSSEAEFENGTNLGVTSDACGITSVTYIDVAVGTCPTVVTRTWTVSDACGNINTCNQTITVDDTVMPTITTCAVTRNIEGCNTSVISGPSFSTVSAPSSEGEFENGTNQGVTSDACGITSVTYLDVAVGVCPTVVTRTWTISDACGNVNTCNQTINVDDNTNPTIDCSGVNNLVLECAEGTNYTTQIENWITAAKATILADPQTTDACDATLVISDDYNGTDVPTLSCGQTSGLVVTFTVMDDCGNIASCNKTVYLDDNALPTIDCSGVNDLVLVCVEGSDYAAQIEAWITAAKATILADPQTDDACDAMLSIVDDYNGTAVPTLSCNLTAGLTVTFTVSDECGNTAACTKTVYLDDNTNPTIDCSGVSDLVLECVNGANYAAQIETWITAAKATILADAQTDDACDATLAIVDDYNGTDVPALSCGLLTGLTVTFTISDECGNTAACTKTVYLDDETDPAIDCSGVNDLVLVCMEGTDYTVQIESWITAAKATILGDMQTMDACDATLVITDNYNGTDIPTLSCTQSSGLMVTFTVTDDCGNTAVCTKTVYLDDNTNPTIDCSGVTDLTLMCMDGADYAAQIEAWIAAAKVTILADPQTDDSCDGTLAITDDYNGSALPSFSCDLSSGLVVTFTVVDECGNTAACTKTVYLDDNGLPTIDCSGVNDLVLVCVEGSDYAAQIESWITAAKATILADPQTDDACDAMLAIVDDYNGTAVPTLSCNLTTGLTVTFTVSDECGNTAACTKTVYLDDNTNPTIDCSGVSDLVLECVEGANYASQIEAWITAAKATILADPQTDDACDAMLAIVDDYNGTAVPTLSCNLTTGLTVTFTVSDECGNTAACTKTVYLDDNTNPTIDCSGVSDLVLECVDGANYASQIEAWITAAKATILADAQTDDACDVMLAIVDDYNGTDVPALSCGLLTGLTVTFTVSDECGNTAACTKTVYLDDSTNPTIDCSNVTNLVMECVDGANYPAQIEAWIAAAKLTILADPQTDDACDVSLAISDNYNGTDVPALSCDLSSGLTVVFTVTDECGNTATCAKTVYIDDTTVPTIDCSDVTNLVMECVDGANYPAQIEAWIAAAKLTILADPQTDDACDVSLAISDNYNGTDVPALSCDLSSGLTVVFTVTDECGNTATCAKTVYIDDTTVPTIDCSDVTNLVMECVDGANYPAQIEAWIAAAKLTILADMQTDDACDTDLEISDDYNGSAVPMLSCNLSSGLAVVFTVTDECGNTAACTKTVYIDDTTVPTIDCSGVNDLVMECVEAANYPAQIEAWIAAAKLTILADMQTDDACDTDLEISDDYNGSAVPMLSCNLSSGLAVVFTVTDECGNTAACTKTVYIDDTTVPTIDCSGVNDLVMECVEAANYPAQIEAWIAAAKLTILADPQTDDACDVSLAISDNYNGTDVPALSCDLSSGLTVVFTVTDECGNTATCAKTVYIDDTTVPTIDCSDVTNLVMECVDGANYPAQIEAWIAAAKLTILADPQTDDACDVSLAISDNYNGTDVPALSCDLSSGLTVVFTVTDECGNTATCAKTVYIDDTTVPTIDCSDVTNLVMECVDGANYPAQIEAWIAAAKLTILADMQTDDACDTDLEISDDYNGSAVPMLSCNLSSGLAVVFTVTDECGNTAACTKTVYIDDTTVPTIDCSGVNDLVMECVEAANYPAQIEAWIAAAKLTILADMQTDDACDTDLEISDDYNGSAVPMLSCNLASGLAVVFTVTDECGNTAACTKTVYIDDTTVPTIDCSGVNDLVMECVEAANYPAQIEAWIAAAKLTILADPQTDDACDVSLAISDNYNGTDVPALSCDLSSGLTVVFTVTDECGNTATCAKTVYIDDTTVPTIDCSDVTNLVMECVDGANYPAQIEAWIAAAKLTILADPQTDDACDVSLAISDNYNGTDVPALSCDLSSGLTVVFTVTDECGNTATCAKTVYIDDTTVPTIDCSDVTNLVMECVDGANYPAQIEAWIAAAKLTILADMQTDDACDTDLEISDDYNGSAVPMLSCNLSSGLAVVFTVTDECGNTAACTKTVYLDDTVAPTVTCPANVTTETCLTQTQIQNQYTTWLSGFLSSDACDGSPTLTYTYQSVESNTPPATAPNVCTGGTIMLTFTATDDCGNTSVACSSSFTVPDNTNPVILICPLPVQIDGCDESYITTPPYSSSLTLSNSGVFGDFPNGGFAGDDCGVSAVFYQDSAPTGTCPVTVLRTWTVEDNCAQTATCVQTITIDDNMPPVVTNAVGSLDASVECSNQPAIDAAIAAIPAATDDCDPTPTISLVSDITTPGSCPQEYVRVRVWNFRDDCGNVSSNFTQTISVMDNIPPNVTTPAGSLNATLECDNIAGINAALALFPAATDNCDPSATITLLSDITTPGACLQEYVRVRVWNFEDDCGNMSASFNQTISVQDNTAPVINTLAGSLDATLECSNASGIAIALALLPAATDNCDATPTLSLISDVTTPGSCPQEYTRVRMWYFRDDCSNISPTFTQTITVQDNTPPVISNAAGSLDASVECSNQPAIDAAIAALPSATDNCDSSPTISLISDVTTPGTCPQEYTRVRVWNFRDDCLNVSTSFTQTISVMDNIPPNVTTPAGSLNATLECDNIAGINAALALFPAATDNCDPSATITLLSDITTPGACTQEYVRVRVWNFEDDCGNMSASFNQTITVQDNTAPVISTPAGSLDATLECSNATGIATALTLVPAATDNCDPTPTLSLISDVTTPGSCPQEYTRVRMWYFRDDCSNISPTFTQTITVEDNTPPVINTPAGSLDATLECSNASGIAAALALAPSATDNCDPTPTISLISDVTTAGTCPQEYVQVRVWNFRDDCLNVSANFTQTITIQDNTPPVISTPAGSLDATLECSNASGIAAALALVPSATDNCDPTPTISLISDVTTAGTCPQEYVRVRVWNFRDDCLNVSANFTQTITIQDNTPPVISTPAGSLDATLECSNASGIAAALALAPTATDNCDATPTISLISDVTTAGTCPQEYVRVRVWNFRDDCLNVSANFTQTITIQDNTPPVISTPAGSLDATLECSDASGIAAALALAPTATDNCDATPTISLISDVTTAGACPQEYVRVRVWNFRDDCLNVSANFTQTITVQDNTPPVISTPAGSLDATLECSNASGIAAALALAPTATDNCDATPTISLISDVTTAGTCPQEYVRGRVWNFRDDCLNVSANFTQTITIQDNTPPVISTPAGSLDATLECSNASGIAAALALAPTATDNCDPTPTISLISDVTTAGTCPQEYVRVRVWNFRDDCLNVSANFTQTITVQDNTPPVISTPAGSLDATLECSNASGIAAALALAPTATDNCDPTPTISLISDVTTAGACPQEYVRVRVWNFRDDCLNVSANFTQTITIQDNTPPVISTPAGSLDATLECSNASGIAAALALAPSATDNCDATPTISLISDVTTAGTCPQEYVRVRVWNFRDDCLNVSANFTQTITVQDNTPPVISTPSGSLDATLECSNASGIAAALALAPTATDNCDPTPTISLISDVTTAGTCPQEYVRVRVWNFRDDCLNVSANFTQTITIQDNTPPVISTPAGSLDATLECSNASGIAAALALVPTATDNCDATPTISLISDVTTAGACPQEYVRVRVWNFRDDCLNVSANFTQTITVQDNTPPVISTPAGSLDATLECSNASGIAAALALAPSATDNCDPTPTISLISDVTTAGTCPQEYVRVRVWNFRDDCLNVSANFTQTITIQDNTPPVISTPAGSLDATLECSDASGIAAALALAPSATDNCDPTPTISLISDVTTAGACPQEYVRVRVWNFRDDCLNVSANFTQTITVEDNTAPVLTCPANTTIECDESILPVNTAMASATDNCDSAPDVTYSDVTVASMTCPQEYTINRTWTATDACGNSSTCGQTITVDDSTAPMITCPANVTIECDESTLPANTDSATATDNCDMAPLVTYSDMTVASQTCPQEYTINRTWIATDACGNSSTCGQTITVDDSTAPMITCPANVTIECDESTLPANTDSATATDNCDMAPLVTYSDMTVASQTCPQEYTINRTWIATDACGNSSTCGQTITVDDSTAPTITTCPPNTTIECDESTLPGNTGTASATDNCDGMPAVTYSDVTAASQTCVQEYTITRTWLATDDCGNTTTCVQVINVDDSTPPMFTYCPPGITIECTESTLVGETGGIATATDNCDASPDVTYSEVTTPGNCPQEYTLSRTWLATDACGNTSTCLQVITIDDSTPPSIVCPPGVTVDCIEEIPDVNTGLVTVSDNCGGPVFVVHVFDMITGQTLACPNSYTITRVYRATDQCGNSATCAQIIIVDDEVPPTIVCPPNVSIECTESTLPINTGMATASDNCIGIPVITYQDVTAAGTCPQEYIITRTWTASDTCENTSSCVQIITIEDTTGPAITFCPANVTVECDESILPGNTGGMASATDNCDGMPTVTYSDVTAASQTCVQEYTISRTWLATDDCGNTTTCVQVITVDDSTPPMITSCPASMTIECDESTLPGNTGMATATDNCDAMPAVTYSDVTAASQTCVQEYTITRTWLATDDCGNTTTCTQVITVDDSTPPMITSCPASMTIECDESTLPGNTGMATATDNCDAMPAVTYSDVTAASQTCVQEYTITRTWLATDDCGNTTTCTQVITVDDSTPPTITNCPASMTIECDESTLPGNTGMATATDNCDAMPAVTYSDVTAASQTCVQEYTITRTWLATDDCGNTTTCTQVITVDDSTPPTITTCPANITIECDESTLPGNTGMASASDNCDGMPTITYVDDTYTTEVCENEYVIDRTWIATDDCGNSSTCLQTILIVDSTPPTITTCPPNTTIECDESILPGNTGMASATDNCDAMPEVTYSDVTAASQTCAQEYSITRTWLATDNCGNTTTCVQVITVDDSTPPTITTCAADITIECDESTLPANTGMAVATDNCDGMPSITYTDDTYTTEVCENEYVISRTWIATDACGNSSTCLQEILIVDTTPPVITTCPANVTIECTDSPLPAFTGTAVATDNCDTAPIVTWSDVTVGGEGYCGAEYGITRTWLATDDCGNTSTCVQVIEIRDNVAPQCSTQDITITEIINPDTGYVVLTPQMIDNGSSDNCGGPVYLEIFPDTLYCVNEGDNIVTLTVTDQCGNTSTCTAVVTLDCIDPCVEVVAWVNLEGAMTDPNGQPNNYSALMRTDLNNLQVLPGQTLVDPFFGNKYTPAGQPYSGAPWIYPGLEGNLFDSGGDPMMGDAGYPATIVDWVLVSVRGDAAGTGGPLCQAAALLHNDGHIEFVEEFDCCNLDLYATYYIVIEHRNHLIVMSHDSLPVDLSNSTITYDFRTQQSYIDDPFGFGVFGQNEIVPGTFAMYAGNGDQTTSGQSDTDINFDDRTFWEGENGDIGEYRTGDYNLNGDTNFNDRVTWERNNGKFTSVPRN